MKKVLIAVLVLAALAAQAQKKSAATDLKKEEKKDQARVNTKIGDGYEGLKWGTLLSQSRESLRGKLYYTDEKSVVITRDGELEYTYGFFYIDPATDIRTDKKTTPPETKDAKGTDKKEKTDEGKLFYVSLRFPYLTMEEVRKKIEDKYGPATGENLKDNQGAVAWNGEKTIIIMWVDRYEKKPYSRRIVYVSKDTTRELNAYQKQLFNKVELELIEKLK